MADRVVGGFSTASLDYEPGLPAANIPPHARFHGQISTKLPSNFRVDRTGMYTYKLGISRGLGADLYRD
jgi:NADH dehydrogenase [ubiquinone] 1 alpha subcomplex assembly factor 1